MPSLASPPSIELHVWNLSPSPSYFISADRRVCITFWECRMILLCGKWIWAWIYLAFVYVYVGIKMEL